MEILRPVLTSHVSLFVWNPRHPLCCRSPGTECAAAARRGAFPSSRRSSSARSRTPKRRGVGASRRPARDRPRRKRPAPGILAQPRTGSLAAAISPSARLSMEPAASSPRAALVSRDQRRARARRPSGDRGPATRLGQGPADPKSTLAAHTRTRTAAWQQAPAAVGMRACCNCVSQLVTRKRPA